MMRRKLITLIFLMTIILPATVLTQAQDGEDLDRPLFMAHYMPWYQTPDVSGYWGWHWTMNHFDPTQVTDAGKPDIASHYIPLTGAYDSQDDAILEYQVLLMKLSGIDGVIVDWYGIEDYVDYAVLNASTNKLFDYIKKAGLKFIICYEDHTIKDMVFEEHLTIDDIHTHGQMVMQYLQDTWFTDDAYVKYDSQPLLFVYGPQYFRTVQDWEKLFSGLDTQPALVTLDKHMDWAALSSYPWPPMSYAGGAELAQPVLESYLDLFYRNAQRRDLIVGSAFPAFDDVYAEADVRSSFGYLDPQNGDTFRLTLDRALQANADLIQLVTWNDYGEGTIIEPTQETGYQYLEIVQDTQRDLMGDSLGYTFDDLRLPLRLFWLRKLYADDAEINQQLDSVFESLLAGRVDIAIEILDELESM